MYIINGRLHQWELVIGLEVHAQVYSNSKLFSGSATDFGADPNSQVAFIDAAMPGMLPVLNEFCVEQAVKTGLGLNAQINKISSFDRKNYFYPDLPQGYQISQFYHPIVSNGSIILDLDGKSKEIRIERLHLEQDAGKSLHDQSPDSSFIDLNRCGIALMEIVSAPDISSPKEAVEYVKKLRSILRYLKTCDGDMEKGSLRCDANVSVRIVGEKKLNTRCEIKNLNSTRYIMKAIEHEAARQVEIYESGGTIQQETRLYDTELDETRSMRSKENARDYRYFPDPDLLPIILTEEYIEKIKKTLPELPQLKKNRYISELGLTEYDALLLTNEKEIADFFEATYPVSNDPKMTANWILGDLYGALNKNNLTLETCLITPSLLAALINLVKSEVISGKIAKEVFETMFTTGENPEIIVKNKNLVQLSDSSEIESIIKQVLADNPDKLGEYKSGKDKLFGFFVGQIMKQSGGKANPKMVNDLLLNLLKTSE